jgi:hypothetical protein
MRSHILLLLAVSACRPAGKIPATAGDSTAPTDGATQTAFVILSPKAGDTLTEGAKYVIRWTTPQGMRINLGAAMGGHDKGYLLSDAPSAPDSLAWLVPVGFVTGFGLNASSDMRLRLEDASDPAHYVEAGPFTIVGKH